MIAIPYTPPFPECPSFRLTPWDIEDTPVVMAAAADPAIHAYTSMPDAEEARAREWISSQARNRSEGRSVHFALRGRDGHVLGNIGLVELDWRHGRAEVGYWVLPQFRRRGFASDALALMSSWAFESLPVARLDLFVDLDNEASKRVAERRGFEYEAHLRSFRVYRGERCDLELYRLLPPPPPA